MCGITSAQTLFTFANAARAASASLRAAGFLLGRPPDEVLGLREQAAPGSDRPTVVEGAGHAVVAPELLEGHQQHCSSSRPVKIMLPIPPGRRHRVPPSPTRP
jgi:hypothetical protein